MTTGNHVRHRGPATAAGHECWAYDDHRAFDETARDYLLGGLDAGEQVWCMPGRAFGPAAAWLQDSASAPAGAVRVVSIADVYGSGHVIDPAGQVAAYTAATDAALAAGFTGLRVVADATALVRSDAQRDAFARYEYLIGRYMRSAPMRAVCAYDRRELGEHAVAELTCMHETSPAAGAAFRLHPGATPAAAVLEGELDMSVAGLFTTALERTDLGPAGGEVTVDARELRFVDHRSLVTLENYAADHRVTAVVRTRLGVAARLAGLLELSHVRVEVAG